ncbi:amidohydrolase [Candidatus Bathyarchaeota archaeon]|nr:MAG: amidohydrolase [Candidatus Bathyarchaeota archaeon]
MLKEKAWKWIDEHREEFIEVSDKVWEYAELGLVEHKSAKLHVDTLRKHGFDVKQGVAGMPTAFIATWGKGKPVIGFMGEYDSLPGISNKAVPHKEWLVEDGCGHGCGHNVHGTSGFMAAIATKYAMEAERLPGTIKVYGSPAEENYDGKVYLVRDGCFKGVDICLSHHPGGMNVAGLASSNAINSVKYEYFGKTAHAAGSPEQGRSALDAIELMNIGVNFLREHVVQEARIHYIIEEGGGQPNVVPDYARSWYYIRAPERAQVQQIYERINKIAQGAAMMTETELKIDLLSAVYNKIPNKALSELVTANMRKIGHPGWTREELDFAAKIGETIDKDDKMNSLIKSKVPVAQKYKDVDLVSDILDAWNDGEVSKGSTDVSDVSWICPTMEFGTSCNVLGAPGHDWRFTAVSGMSIGHKSLIFAAKTMAGSALDLFTEPAWIKRAWEEHEKRLAGREYVCHIPDNIHPPLEMAEAAWQKLKGKQ